MALRRTIGASKNRGMSKEQRVTGSRDVEQSSRPGKSRAEMVFDIGLGGVQVVAAQRSAPCKDRCRKRRVLTDISTADRKHVVLELRNPSIILKVRGTVSVAILASGDIIP